MSQLGAESGTHALQQIASLLDQLVGTAEQSRWDFEAKSRRGPKIDDQLEMGWLLDRQVGWFGALQDFVNVDCSLAKKVDISRRVGHQPAFLGEPPRHRHRRHSMLHR